MQILNNAKHQFAEGDVLHWWLEPKNFGLRTRFKDDYLWLVYATSEYLKYTSDTEILFEKVPFVVGDVLNDYEEEKGVSFTFSEHDETLYEHCRLAIERTLNDLGKHGLPKMGGGDWNDGMNKIGIQGLGESVWLGFFFYDLLERFIQITKVYNPNLDISRYQEARENLKNHLNKDAWDGEYYLRAFFDNGEAVGSASSEECKIDLISQSFSFLSGVVPEERKQSVLDAVEHQLVDKKTGIVKLLTPAFKNSKNYPGYIMDYPVGVRENGGQYTHSVAWYIMALLKENRFDDAYEIYQMVNPIQHSKTDKEVETYMVEPYVIAADIYSNPDHKGRGGWTWYTGSSGWFYRVGLEYICGFTLRGEELEITPHMPTKWTEIKINYHYLDTIYQIVVSKEEKSKIIVDGKKQDKILLVNDGKTHQIKIGVDK